MAHPIVFFDGVCGLCNRFVDRTVRTDTAGVLRFAPIQGETARRMLPQPPADSGEWTIVYVDESGMRERSDAVIAIWRRLGGIGSLLALCRFVPRPLRDAVYRVVARNRYRWFGRREQCRIPTTGEADKFLP